MRSFLTGLILAGLVAATASLPVVAGAAKGPTRRSGTVQGFGSLSWRIAFQANKPAVVEVQGDGDSPLAVVVLDPAGKRVAIDTRNPDHPTARWTPATAGLYQIKVVNRGGVPNHFHLKTN
jgi:hypothetical protein